MTPPVGSPAATSSRGVDVWVASCFRGAWLPFLPESLREPVARAAILAGAAVVTLLVVAPWVDARGERYLEDSFTRTLGALAATRALDSAISLAQSSEISISLGPGGSIGIGQALDPVNDLVEQYGALLLTSTTALGVQRLGMQLGKALSWWLFLPSFGALVAAAVCGGQARGQFLGWGRRLFGIALFVRLALPVAGWVDSVIAERFLEGTYQDANAVVTATTRQIEQVEESADERPWYERYNPVSAVGAIGDRARRVYDTLAAAGESIVDLAIYFTLSTIILPLGTLWLLSRLTGGLFAPRSPS